MREIHAALLAVALGGVLPACASVHETYFLSTYDPATDARNYFRIRVDGFSSTSKIKFSVGFYDKQAVERLFGEQLLQREYLGTEVDVFDADTGKRLADISDRLEQARKNAEKSDLAHLRVANASVAGLLIKYEIRLQEVGRVDEYRDFLDRIRKSHEEAAALLAPDAPPAGDLAKADNAITTALVGLHAIRVAVDGDLLVRFFDGAGNEMDVASMAQVIFVASDVSEFAEAVRRLADERQIQEDVLDIVLGPRMAEAQRAIAEAASSEKQAELAGEALEELLAKPSSDDADELRQLVLDAAATIADGPSMFRTSAEIRAYLEGREP